MPIRKKKNGKKKKKSLLKKQFAKGDEKSKGLNVIRNSVAVRKKAKCIFTKQKHSTNDFDKGGVKRIFSHFNKFYKTRPSAEPKTMVLENVKTCLTPKEKSYLICSCQTRTSRYSKLKNLAAEAIKNNKIFLICGYCNPIRQALVERGWVEKIPPNRMDLAKLRAKRFTDNSEMHSELEKLLLSNFVDKYEPNFIWNSKDETDNSQLKNNSIIYNRLRVQAQWTTKQGLCAAIKNNHWYYIEDVSEVSAPRTYTCLDDGEKDDFVKDYKLTACTSLLKWVLSMVANDRAIFVESGNIAINVIVFALNRCKEYLFCKQNKDIDKFCMSSATPGQWNSFLKKYYLIIAKQDLFKVDKDDKLPLYLGYAKFLLKEIHKYRPQLSCEGCHNIWIIKPAHCSRGRGIRMASKLAVLSNLLNRGKYVFQKYIEEPLLLHETKFDVRQYYLISNTCPLVIWMYKDCYLKFSTQKYNLKNYHESIHLTNNAVQRKYKNCDDRHPELPDDNMWELDTYKAYLRRIGKEDLWDKVIYPGMKKTIVGTMLSCQESTSYSKNRFELYGCDFILDKDYKPWLIEINSCPDLKPTTQVTAKICPAVLTDIIKVVVDYAADTKASTGKFECIYRQSISVPRYGTGADLTIRGYALPVEYFYRGNIIQIEDSCSNHIGKHQDINAMLHKLRMIYETDIMVEPEDDESTLGKKASKLINYVHNTQSEDDLNEVATVITEQLDDLLSRITSENSPCIKSSPNTESSVSSPSSINLLRKNFFAEVDDIQTASDVKTFLNISISQLEASEVVRGKSCFNFSLLDDGPEGKGSGIIGVNTNEVENTLPQKTLYIKEECYTSSKKEENIYTKTRIINKESEAPNDSIADVIETTNRLFYFLNNKVQEYSSGLR